jgi:hypothetical protein
LSLIANIIEIELPQLIHLSELMKVVQLASNISLSHLNSEVFSLSRKLGLCGEEFTSIDSSKKENEIFNETLRRRIRNFLDTIPIGESFAPLKKLENLVVQLNATKDSVESLMNLFGASLKESGGSGDDPCKEFFTSIVQFVSALNKVWETNKAKKQQERENLQRIADAKSRMGSNKSNINIVRSKDSESENETVDAEQLEEEKEEEKLENVVETSLFEDFKLSSLCFNSALVERYVNKMAAGTSSINN